MLRKVTTNDIDRWLTLASEVEHLFGPMVKNHDFISAIKECINNGNAFCLEYNGQIAGLIAINRRENEISWLATAKEFRGRRIARRLVDKALEELDKTRDITVQTFSGDTIEGKAARSLYLKSGFDDYKKAGKNPAGIETVIMLRKAIIKNMEEA